MLLTTMRPTHCPVAPPIKHRVRDYGIADGDRGAQKLRKLNHYLGYNPGWAQGPALRTSPRRCLVVADA